MMSAVGRGQSPPTVTATRLPQNPLITVSSSKTLGDNVNGPTVIRVPSWVQRPLGRYYMYFANHMGTFIRLAYADAVTGPWKVYEPGVLDVRDTAFYRAQPDPVETLDDFYTHVASPEILLEANPPRMVMWTHGWWTRGEQWPAKPSEARAWAREHGYGQYTQAAVSTDGLHFTVQPAITRTSYVRVFMRGASYYGVSRLGLVSKASDPLVEFAAGPNLFVNTPYAGRVRHVALVLRGDSMFVFFTAIGDAPEHVVMARVDLSGDWTMWRAGGFVDVLAPETAYECVSLPNAPSESGDISKPVKQIRDPFVFEEDGRAYLFYSTCGEQGIAAAELRLP
ncbi:MAG: hypothetical protein U0Q11_13380 [Vicinamibacterales bacterium]